MGRHLYNKLTRGRFCFGEKQQELCEMWILLEKHRTGFGVRCYLLQLVVKLVADLMWPKKNNIFTTYDYHISCRVLHFYYFQRNCLRPQNFPISRFLLPFDILDFYFLPEQKQRRQISNKNVNSALQTKQWTSHLF